MQKTKGKIGGFAGLNHGTIENCYSLISVRGRKSLSGGFVADNDGVIERCYACSPLRSLTGGFTGTDDVKITSCYFLYNADKAGRKALSRLVDAEYGQRYKNLRSEDDYAALGFDTKNIWEKGNARTPLWFKNDQWATVPEPADGKVITISTANELYSFAHRVNEGDPLLRRAHVRLTADLNLGGKDWTPIGREKSCAFEGVFDGAGHSVKNFTVKKKNLNFSGFFGYLKGSVYNLSLDCNIRGSVCCGALAAKTEGGEIGCCDAVTEIKCKHGTAGGLVGSNGGRIFESYAAGRASAGIFLLPLLLGIFACLL